MAVCLACNADYLSGITVCPACNRPLEDPREDLPSGDYVTIMRGHPGEIHPALATLNAAGIPAIISDEHAAMVVPLIAMTLQVPASDAEAARAILTSK